MIDLTLAAVVVVFIVDVSGAMDTVKEWLSRWLGHRVTSLRPFDCSLCAVWWTCLVVVICEGRFGFAGIACSAWMALLARPMGAAMHLVQEICLAAVRFIDNLIQKI